MSIKDLFIRKMIQSKMKDVPAEEQEKIINIISKNPDLFQKIAMEVQSLVGNGTDQMSAVREVLEKHKNELTELSK